MYKHKIERLNSKFSRSSNQLKQALKTLKFICNNLAHQSADSLNVNCFDVCCDMWTHLQFTVILKYVQKLIAHDVFDFQVVKWLSSDHKLLHRLTILHWSLEILAAYGELRFCHNLLVKLCIKLLDHHQFLSVPDHARPRFTYLHRFLPRFWLMLLPEFCNYCIAF